MQRPCDTITSHMRFHTCACTADVHLHSVSICCRRDVGCAVCSLRCWCEKHRSNWLLLAPSLASSSRSKTGLKHACEPLSWSPSTCTMHNSSTACLCGMERSQCGPLEILECFHCVPTIPTTLNPRLQGGIRNPLTAGADHSLMVPAVEHRLGQTLPPHVSQKMRSQYMLQYYGWQQVSQHQQPTGACKSVYCGIIDTPRYAALSRRQQAVPVKAH
jgi:hypothetical protein